MIEESGPELYPDPYLVPNQRIQIRKVKEHTDPTDPDPQHWFLVLEMPAGPHEL
jgi:hypothetical protein